MGLLQECGWTRGGHRLYDESAFERLDSIEELKASGMKLGQIRLRLSGAPAT
ncbi:MAG: MerR family transcriptional regulator [Planctomycetaceae bacterium]|nr:MerR family transcriptional regulator [Planctomycetaceae bacterium]